MTGKKTDVPPHLFQADPDQGSDVNGRQVCRGCNLLGRPGDTHHAMPEPVADVRGLAAGEGGDR
jgi:hypothetical protein